MTAPLIHIDPGKHRWHGTGVMKMLSLGLAPVLLALSSCESMNASFDGTGSFDPLVMPGSGSQNGDASYGPDLRPGVFVSANIPNTAFYKNKPKGDEDADKLLTLGTNMKIISVETEYVKVELDSGEVGWVPSVMVASAAGAAGNLPIDGDYGVYPPIPGGDLIEPLPVIDPDGLPPGSSVPPVIDPDAPAPAPEDPVAVDPVPTPETEPAPAEGEEEKTGD